MKDLTSRKETEQFFRNQNKPAMNYLVKILYNEDGDKVENPKWCLVIDYDGAYRTFCDGQVFGLGEGNAQYKEKHSKRGITCPACIGMIKEIKSVKL